MNDFVDEILEADAGANVIVLGDINDFEFSETVEILEGEGELYSAIKDLPAGERYSYVFEGNSQVLDQILLSRTLFDRFDLRLRRCPRELGVLRPGLGSRSVGREDPADRTRNSAAVTEREKRAK